MILTGQGRRGARSSAVMMLGIAFASTSDAASDGRDRAAFIEAHRRAVVTQLNSIHLRGPRSTSRDRFLAVSVVRADQRYVQCIFFDGDTKMYCEASSGAYAQAPDATDHLLSASSKAALHRLGFVQTSPKQNYEREISLGTPPDFDAVADLMIGALHDAYEARETTPLNFRAPRAILTRNACPGPVS